jgi:hypothetical protein
MSCPRSRMVTWYMGISGIPGAPAHASFCVEYAGVVLRCRCLCDDRLAVISFTSIQPLMLVYSYCSIECRLCDKLYEPCIHDIGLGLCELQFGVCQIPKI